MNAIDLFAGCGGLSKGFMDAGFKILVGVDNDAAALNTFSLNHDGAIALNADLSQQETFDKIKSLAGDRSIDVVIAGPPCQSEMQNMAVGGERRLSSVFAALMPLEKE